MKSRSPRDGEFQQMRRVRTRQDLTTEVDSGSAGSTNWPRVRYRASVGKEACDVRFQGGILRGSSTTLSDRHSAVSMIAIAVVTAGLALAAPGFVARASAAACSTSTGASSCTVTANLTVTAGTLTLESSPNLYWSFDSTGYDQWASGSGSALSSCSASGAVTHCSGGTSPLLIVLDGTGSSSGWAVSEYLSANTLPTGAV